MSITTISFTAPSAIEVTLPANWFLALNFNSPTATITSVAFIIAVAVTPSMIPSSLIAAIEIVPLIFVPFTSSETIPFTAPSFTPITLPSN